MRRAVLGLITVVALCLSGVTPASAASRPAQVGLVSFTAASPSSLTVAWNKASGATKYEVFVSSSYSGVLSAKAKGSTSGLSYKITGLKANTDYFVQVRAKKGSTAGSRSSRVGHRTIKVAGPMTGSDYSMMTYNVCSRMCEEDHGLSWSNREPGVLERINHLQPDVVALQESECETRSGGRWWYAPPAGYAETTCKSAKRLLYKKSRFDIATSVPIECSASAKVAPTPSSTPTPTIEPTPTPTPTSTPTSTETAATPAPETAPAPEAATPEPETTPTTEAAPAPAAAKVQAACPAEDRTGWIQLSKDDEWPGDLGDKYAVWAELVDKPTGKHVIFVSAHLVAGGSNALAERRRRELVVLVNRIHTLNPNKLPIIYAGDFNSHKNRSNDTVATLFNSIGFYDAFDQAMILGYQHYNSFNGFKTTPILGIKWGDHVDHFWVVPGRTRVWSWYNAARFVSGKYPAPIPSDHSPLTVVVRVN